MTKYRVQTAKNKIENKVKVLQTITKYRVQTAKNKIENKVNIL